MSEVVISNGKITRDKKQITSIFPLLNKGVEFHKDLTVLGLLKAIKPFAHEVNLAFHSQLGGFDVNEYINEAEKKVKKEDDDDIDYCEVHWAVDYTKVKKYEAFYDWPDFHGCKKKQKMTYGLDFSPINTYKNKPLILNTEYEIGLLHIVNKKTERTSLLKTKKDFSFFEAVGAILNDMSFYGPPSRRDAKGKELMGTVEEAKKELKKELDKHGKHNGQPAVGSK